MREWLVECRKERKMSQAAVAKDAGISQGYYAEIESGVKGRPVNVNTAKKIAGVLGFAWTMFYDDSLEV